MKLKHFQNLWISHQAGETRHICIFRIFGMNFPIDSLIISATLFGGNALIDKSINSISQH